MQRKKLVIILVLGFLMAAVAETLLLVSMINTRNKTSADRSGQPQQLDATIPSSTEPALGVPDGIGPALVEVYTKQNALAAISTERMFARLTELTRIQPHSGWRGAGTTGEKEAFDYLESRLTELEWLTSLGMSSERERFNIFLGTEVHQSSLFLTLGAHTYEVPADATRGSRDNPAAALRMDSDGFFNPPYEDPVEVTGFPLLIPDAATLNSLEKTSYQNKVFLVDYALVDTENPQALSNALSLLRLNPAAIVLITRFSNTGGQTHGTFAGDGGGVLQRVEGPDALPLLFIEFENLFPLGIHDWDEMNAISQARVIWDTDVLNPAPSGNLVVRIPGKYADKPILLSAHIDSPNSPGALDNGSGSVILLEILTVLNDLKIQPENDLFFAWFGSEEAGLYGSTSFTTTHSDLLGKLQANIQIDCLTRPLDGLPASIMPMYSHISTSDLNTDPFKTFMDETGAELGLELKSIFYEFASDNGSLSAFNIPNTNLIYQSMEMENYPGGVWVSGHLHDPYDTVELARDMEAELRDMARLALAAALSGNAQIDFVQHDPQKQAVFLANHTEAPHMTPSGLSRFSKSLIRAGYGITVIPYGEPLTTQHISGADLVVALPAYDYPLTDAYPAAYDTGWTAVEAAILNEYVEQGGKLLVVNSANRLKLFNRIAEPNEDWSDLNVLTNQWGVNFTTAGVDEATAAVTADGWLQQVSMVNLNPQSAVTFAVTSGEVLAGSRSRAHIAKLKVGTGTVLIFSDLSMLGDYGDGLFNPKLVQALAAWE